WRQKHVGKLSRKMFIQNYNLLAEVEGFGQKLVESANGIIDEVEPEGDINKFLKDLNLKEYLVKFNDKEIDMNRLKTMKFDDLKALGVPLAGISLDNLLQSLCLKKYLKMFLDNNNIDINTLKQRNMSDLKALHIPIVRHMQTCSLLPLLLIIVFMGPRMKLLEAIRFLRPAQSEIHTGLEEWCGRPQLVRAFWQGFLSFKLEDLGYTLVPLSCQFGYWVNGCPPVQSFMQVYKYYTSGTLLPFTGKKLSHWLPKSFCLRQA
ncbi:hypothetical protein IFM89_024792, partial [Coptis chinensis]